MIEIMEILQWVVIGVLFLWVAFLIWAARRNGGVVHDWKDQNDARCERIEEQLDALMTNNMKHRVKKGDDDAGIDHYWQAAHQLPGYSYIHTPDTDVDLSAILDLILERLDVTVKPPESITEPAKLIPIEKPKKGK